ncbi:MAG: DUF1800 domain-containing protein [Ignavibacteriales bacterium]|nr:DUF1800 domain-containing protein [Ignavibacteriales bacterium]
MKREDFLKVLISAPFILSLSSCKSDKNDSFKSLNKELEKKSSRLSDDELAFLLRRTTFGFTKEDYQQCKELEIDEILELLFSEYPHPHPPINFEFVPDVFTNLGDTWVDKPYLKQTFFEQYRKKSLQAWILKVIVQEKGVSIREQMTLFWHNHFGVSDIVEHKYEYIHNELLRTYAFGNYKELIKKVTIDPAMLRFLSGFENNRKAPNENYARELLELFTIGKGALKGEGNYTNYTEGDVRALARALTGWTDVGWYANYKHIPIGAKFQPLSHDPYPVKLSEELGNKTIMPLFNKRYEEIIDIIFEKPETSKFICRKLYRWFVDSEISNEIEDVLIEPLAYTLVKNDFEIKPVLYQLFSSKYFYTQIPKISKTKNPLEYVATILRNFPFDIPDNINFEYNFWHQMFNEATSMGMEYFKPPSVAGWKSYYQAPLYYNSWINAATLNNKQLFCTKFFDQGFKYENSDVKINIKKWLEIYLGELSVDYIVTDLTQRLFAINLGDRRIGDIKRQFLKGLTDESWSQLAKKYIEDEDFEKEQFEANCINGLKYIFSLPEFHLI